MLKDHYVILHVTYKASEPAGSVEDCLNTVFIDFDSEASTSWNEVILGPWVTI